MPGNATAVAGRTLRRDMPRLPQGHTCHLRHCPAMSHLGLGPAAHVLSHRRNIERTPLPHTAALAHHVTHPTIAARRCTRILTMTTRAHGGLLGVQCSATPRGEPCGLPPVAQVSCAAASAAPPWGASLLQGAPARARDLHPWSSACRRPPALLGHVHPHLCPLPWQPVPWHPWHPRSRRTRTPRPRPLVQAPVTPTDPPEVSGRSVQIIWSTL